MTNTERIKEIIKDNQGNYQFSVSGLAKEIGYSYSYLYEIVNKMFDMSPRQLIETIRMEEALRMTATGKKQVKIYKLLGYSNIRSFRDAFMRRFRVNFSQCKSNLCWKAGPAREKEMAKYIALLWKTDD